MSKVYLYSAPVWNERVKGFSNLIKHLRNGVQSKSADFESLTTHQELAEVQDDGQISGLILFLDQKDQAIIEELSTLNVSASWVIVCSLKPEHGEQLRKKAASFEYIFATPKQFSSSLQSYVLYRVGYHLEQESEELLDRMLLQAVPPALEPLMRGIERTLEEVSSSTVSGRVRHKIKQAMLTLLQAEDVVDELNLVSFAKHRDPASQSSFSVERVFHRLKEYAFSGDRADQLSITFELDPEIPLLVKGNETLVHRVLLQLLENSIEHTRNGQITCSAQLVSLPSEELTHAWLRFEVKDTGIGLSAEDLDLVRQGKPFKAAPGKLGTGLALVQSAVKEWGGIFEIDSSKQKGTRCCIQLPFAILEEQPDHTSPDEDLPQLKGRRILIVEDNPVNMSVIEQVVTETGATISKAKHGKEAIQILKKQTQDIILMDVQMPEMDGIQTTKQIVKKYAHWHPDIQLPHIIALTAAAMDGDRDRCINAGMVDYITKPFRADHVFDTLGKWMERRETPPDPNLLDKVVSSSRDTVASSKATSDERGININSNGNDNGKDYRVTDINKLYDYARGNEQVVANMVDVFLEHTPDYINNLRKQVERGAWKAVKKQAHKMKPQMGYVGLDRVVILLERVEEEALERQRADQVKALLRKVEELCDQAMEELVLWRDKQELAADS